MVLHREVKVPLAWRWVSEVRDMVGEALAEIEQESRDLAVMAASELAENVVKYGEPVDGEDSGRVGITLDGRDLSITAVSGARDQERVAHVLAEVAAIGTASDVQSLYVERLQRLLEHPSADSGGLGLLRIAFEGGFRLSATHEQGLLTITARRTLP